MQTEDQETVHDLPAVDERCFNAFFGSPGRTLSVEAGSASHQGLVRAENQDHFLVVRRQRRQEVVACSIPPDTISTGDDETWLLLVADGVGGGAFGEVASRLVVTKIAELSAGASSWLMSLPDEASREPYLRVRRYVETLQQAFRDARARGLLTDPSGTTCTCAYLVGTHAVLANIGDSRAYLLRDGQLRQLTKDHTLAQQLIELGVARDRAGKFGHVLTKHLGTHDRAVNADVNCVRLSEGDNLLVCSDGLTNELDDEQIAAVLRLPESPQQRCDKLLHMALAAGGRDNITVVLASVRAL